MSYKLTLSNTYRRVMSMPEGKVFSIRELLSDAPRSRVDADMQRMKADGIVVRLARGIYARPVGGDLNWTASPLEIVRVKIAAFQRHIVGPPGSDECLPKDPLASLEVERDQSVLHFDTNGSSSSFRLHSGQTVKLRHAAPRKMKLSSTVSGRPLRAMWDKKITLEKWEESVGKRGKNKALLLLPFLPAWLSDVVGYPWNHKFQSCNIFQKTTESVIHQNAELELPSVFAKSRAAPSVKKLYKLQRRALRRSFIKLPAMTNDLYAINSVFISFYDQSLSVIDSIAATR